MLCYIFHKLKLTGDFLNRQEGRRTLSIVICIQLVEFMKLIPNQWELHLVGLKGMKEYFWMKILLKLLYVTMPLIRHTNLGSYSPIRYDHRTLIFFMIEVFKILLLLILSLSLPPQTPKTIKCFIVCMKLKSKNA